MPTGRFFHSINKGSKLMTLSCRLVASALCLVVSTTLLNGCTSAYQAPYSADSATMIVHNASGKKMSLRVFGDAAECTKGQLLKPMLLGGEQRTIYLPTHGEVAMSMGQDLGVEGPGIKLIGCFNMFSFFPKPGRIYLLDVGATEACNVAVLEKTSSDERQVVPVELIPRKRTVLRPLTEEGPFCTQR
jgi:hypothetical protein